MLQGKIALVTGGSSGIGKAIAKRFARAGARVAVVASSNMDKAKAAVAEIVADGGEAYPYVVDVRERKAVRSLVSEVERRYGTIGILVTSAGIFLPTPIGEADPTVFDQMIDVNVKGTFHCIEAVVPSMKAAGVGRIICLSSAADRLGIAGFATYCATKGAVTMMVKSLALELAPHNININAISPGNTATPMNEGMRTDPAQRALLETLNAATPSLRNFSEAEDIAELALFLASPPARAMHGSSVLIDEGLSAGVLL
jgi:NAD(P)-dependent dehydrogenase (short-subunit alcohol dehydrogenase family)